MPSSDFIAVVVAGGQQYSAWESVMVRRDYGNWCSVFEFRAAEPNVYGDGGWANLRLKPGDPVQIILGGVQVINGNVTTRQASFDAQSHELVIAGKSLTQNLHSSVVVKPGNYNGNTFEQATRGVLGPVGVNLSLINPPSMASKPFTSLAVQFGESVGEFVERIAKMRGLFLTDDENGNLVASQVDPSAAAVAELQEGRNILRATCKLDDQSLWNGLSVVGQQTGNDQNWPPRDNSATVQNPNGPPNRTQIIAAEHPADATDLQQRANFEAAHSSWPFVEAQITVVGWKKDDGSLWVPTENVTVYSPTLFPSESGSMTLGISACTYLQDSESGTTTVLELRLPKALSTLPNPATATPPAAGDIVSNPNPNQAQIDQPDVADA